MSSSRLTSRAQERIDNSWLIALRILLGMVMAWSAARYLIFGWVARFYVWPTYYFSYPGFEWVQPLESSMAMHLVFVLLVILGLMVATGLLFRAACLAFTALFAWVCLMDVTNYLNHYYLLIILGGLLTLTPANRRWSLDVKWGLVSPAKTIPRWVHWFFRAQVAIVYFYAGIAKLQPDWLLHAQPLNIWLLARTDYPVFGPLFAYWEIALAMSWAGFFFDLTIWAWLLWSRTRPFAYAVVIVFHTMTAYLFQIGVFPLIMTVAATVFFAPEWARRLMSSAGMASEKQEPPKDTQYSESSEKKGGTQRFRGVILSTALVWLGLQLFIPARTLAYGGNVLWHEQGMKWSWRVMVRAKYGTVSYKVRRPSGEVFMVQPAQYLTSYQAREMSTRPALILQLAHHIGEEYEEKLGEKVEVHAVTAVSLNSRSPKPILRSSTDLMTITSRNELRDIIVPAPDSSPLHLGTQLLELEK